MFLEANPDYYDYIHRLQLNDDGTASLCDGGGQVINFKGSANYMMEYDSDKKGGTLKMFDIVLKNAYSKEQIPVDRSEINIRFIIEYGQYILTEGRCWNLPSVFDEKLLIYTKRYVFESDPLKLEYQTRNHNLFNMIENIKELSERTYYNNKDVTRKTRREWLKEGNSFNETFCNTYNLNRKVSDPLAQYLVDLSPSQDANKNLELFKRVSDEAKQRKRDDYTIVDKAACLFSKNGECVSIALTRWYNINRTMYAHILLYYAKDGHEDNEFIKNIVCYYDDAFIFDKEFDYNPFQRLLCFAEDADRRKSIQDDLQKYGLSDKTVMYCEKFDL
jgi:hypothetical protein